MATSTNLQAIADYVSTYLVENFVGAKSLVNTGLVSQSTLFEGASDGYTGRVRYFADFNPTVNVSDESSNDGQPSDISAVAATFIKTSRNFSTPIRDVTAAIARDSNVLTHLANQVVTQTARMLDKSVLNVLDGVATAEVLAGAGQTSTTTRAAANFVDLNAIYDGTDNKLVGSTDPNKGVIDAAYYLYKDRAWDEQLYLVCSPEAAAALDNANATESATVTDSVVGFRTMLGGRVVVVPVAHAFKNFGASARVSATSTKTAFLIKAGTMAWNAVPVENPSEVARDPEKGSGGGSTTLYTRAGYIIHPGSGYNWSGNGSKYAADTNGADDSYNRTGITESNWSKVGTNGAGNIGVIVSA